MKRELHSLNPWAVKSGKAVCLYSLFLDSISVVFCQDSSISTSIPVLDLIDAIQPQSINFDLVKDGQTDEDKMDNAKYDFLTVLSSFLSRWCTLTLWTPCAFIVFKFQLYSEKTDKQYSRV